MLLGLVGGTCCGAAAAARARPRRHNDARRPPTSASAQRGGGEGVGSVTGNDDSGSSTRRAFLQHAAAAAAAGLVAGPALAEEPRPSLADATRPVLQASPLPSPEAAVADLFDAASYSVVNVVDVTIAAAGGGRSGTQVDTPEGNGTGIVWDKEGNIVTNYHVLGSVLSQARASGERQLKQVARVTLLGSDGFSHDYIADLVGADRSKDLAVLRIQAPPELLRPIRTGSSAPPRVGQSVFAIGNPFGFDLTLTSGVVSGLNRQIRSQAGSFINNAIQTDAAINPGSSGGPLLNSKGELVGLNTAIFTPTGSSVGVGFAIPAETVARIVPQLVQFGRVVRPSLNISLAGEQIAAQLRVKGGALVQGVPPGSAAARAGLLPTRRGLGGIVTGDVIVGLDDDPVRNNAELLDLIDRHAIGDRVVLHIVRGVGGDAPETMLDLVVVELEAESGQAAVGAGAGAGVAAS